MSTEAALAQAATALGDKRGVFCVYRDGVWIFYRRADRCPIRLGTTRLAARVVTKMKAYAS